MLVPISWHSPSLGYFTKNSWPITQTLTFFSLLHSSSVNTSPSHRVASSYSTGSQFYSVLGAPIRKCLFEILLRRRQRMCNKLCKSWGFIVINKYSLKQMRTALAFSFWTSLPKYCIKFHGGYVIYSFYEKLSLTKLLY